MSTPKNDVSGAAQKHRLDHILQPRPIKKRHSLWKMENITLETGTTLDEWKRKLFPLWVIFTVAYIILIISHFTFLLLLFFCLFTGSLFYESFVLWATTGRVTKAPLCALSAGSSNVLNVRKADAGRKAFLTWEVPLKRRHGSATFPAAEEEAPNQQSGQNQSQNPHQPGRSRVRQDPVVYRVHCRVLIPVVFL